MTNSVEIRLKELIKTTYFEINKKEPSGSIVDMYFKGLKEGKNLDWLTNMIKNNVISKPIENKQLKLPKQKSITNVLTYKNVDWETSDKLTNNILNVFLCVRDNEDDISVTFTKLKKLERKHKELEFYYYVLENDSKDDTPHVVLDFFNYSKGKFRIEKSEKKKWGAVADNNRVKDMAKYRNMMKDLCNTWENSEYSIIVDTEITFDDDILEKYISIMQNNKTIVMATPYGTVQETNRYYDTFAFHAFDKRPCVYTYDEEREIFPVHSAFAGFAIIRSKFLKDAEWKESNINVSEHNMLCEQLRKFGQVVVCKNIVVRWKVGKSSLK